MEHSKLEQVRQVRVMVSLTDTQPHYSFKKQWHFQISYIPSNSNFIKRLNKRLYLLGAFIFSALPFLALWGNILVLSFLHFWCSRFSARTNTHRIKILKVLVKLNSEIFESGSQVLTLPSTLQKPVCGQKLNW